MVLFLQNWTVSLTVRPQRSPLTVAVVLSVRTFTVAATAMSIWQLPDLPSVDQESAPTWARSNVVTSDEMFSKKRS